MQVSVTSQVLPAYFWTHFVEEEQKNRKVPYADCLKKKKKKKKTTTTTKVEFIILHLLASRRKIWLLVLVEV